MVVRSWVQYVQDNNISQEQNQAGPDKLAKGDLPEGANIPKVIVEAYKDGVLAAGAAYLGSTASIGKVAVSTVIAGIANGSYQLLYMSSPGNEGKTYDYWSTATAAATGAMAPGRGIWANTGIAAGSAVFTDGPDAGAVGGAVAGSVAGGYFGEYAPGLLKPALGISSGFWAEIGGAYTSEILGDATKDAIDRAGNNK